MHDFVAVFIFMLLFIKVNDYQLTWAAIIYRLEGASTVGLMARAVPQWVTLLNLILLGQLRRWENDDDNDEQREEEEEILFVLFLA